jgi:shikimate kinase
LVIACGGGIVLNKLNIERLRKSAKMVYLTASPGVIQKRVTNDEGQRPLLKVDNPELTIREMLSFRKPFYEGAADIKIDTSKLDINAVAKQIISKLREDESFNF